MNKPSEHHRNGSPSAHLSKMDRMLCDLASGRLSEPARSIMQLMVNNDAELKSKFEHIKELYVDYSNGEFDEPVAAVESLLATAWSDTVAALRRHAEYVRQWWVDQVEVPAPGLPLAVLCSSDGGKTLDCDFWEALKKQGLSSLRLPVAAPIESVFLPDSTIVFSWRRLPADIPADANVLVLLSRVGEELFRMEGNPVTVEGEKRMKVVLDAKDILKLYALEVVDNPMVEVTWSYGGGKKARVGILLAKPDSDSTPCTREECKAIADVALAWVWPRRESDAETSIDIACFANALLRIDGEQERALIRDFLSLRDYVWSSVPDELIERHPVFSYLAAAAALRSGGFIKP